MLMKILRGLAVGGAVAMLTVAILTTGPMFAQSATPTPPSDSMPAGMDGMMDMASPAADASMEQMMERCMAMMDMMMGMMGDGDMSGMMATPGTGMVGMGTPASGT